MLTGVRAGYSWIPGPQRQGCKQVVSSVMAPASLCWATACSPWGHLLPEPGRQPVPGTSSIQGTELNPLSGPADDLLRSKMPPANTRQLS